jgi:diguanylate cyclase (GGDEF)-like protein
MKHSLSIKLFSLVTILLLILGISFVFLNFYNHSKENIESLLTSNIQTNSLKLKHYLDTNLQDQNINQIKSHLDLLSNVNDSIENIYIYNEKRVPIYSSDRNFDTYDSTNCIPIFEILNNDIFHNSCYTISTKFYKGLKPFYYSTHIYLSQTYLDSLFYDQTMELLFEYFITVILMFFITWLIISKVIKTPLEKLRQYAYYENKPPQPFYIQEIESIRYSLEMTFNRLHKEQQELYSLSTRDQLSGLYNKRSLIEKMDWLISEKSRKKEKFAVMFIDLDNFKTVNDSMGHNIGDKVLQEVSNQLLASVRKHDIVSRIGGDEFVVVLSQIDIDTRIIEVIERIRTTILTPILLQSIKYQITASMGIALYPKDGTDTNTLMRNADIAMYKSKELGKNIYHFFTDSYNVDIQQKVSIQNLLIEALENHYFELYYQPKVDIKTQKVSSCEALIRLIHPKKGLISPNEFISIAEENNFIVPLGYWVIEESVRQLKAWRNTPFQDIKVSINLSAKQFQDTQLISKLKEYTQDIDRSKLDIELTESVFVNSFDSQHTIINEIKKLGFSLSLDDFGTGYSSLSYLKNIPFNTLKIDKTFIDDLETEKGKEFVRMIINIAVSLGLEVVAEGVETEKQKAYLDSVNCKCYQGYLFSKPLPIEGFEMLLKSKKNL